MKKILLLTSTIICGIVGFYSTIAAGFSISKGEDYQAAILIGFLGVTLPVVVLEVVKSILKPVEKNSLGIVISAAALFLMNSIYISDGIFDALIEEFVPLQLPWIISLLVQILSYVYKSKKANNKNL